MIRWWIDLWDRHEAPTMLAAIRIAVGTTLFFDFVTIGALDLVETLFVGPPGGVAFPHTGWARWWAHFFGTGPAAGWALWGALLASSLAVVLGVFTRVSLVALVLLSAQFALTLPAADRAIDTLLRNALFVLAFSGAGRAWSIDAWRRTGSLSGDGKPVPAWPRYLIVLQLVVVYFAAGVSKYAQHWWPWGDYAGLWIILHDWDYTAVPREWLAATEPVSYRLTQLGTAVTMVFQWTYPVVLLHYFPPPGEAGWLRRRLERHSLHLLWIGTGAVFHVGIALTMSLGIFPWGTLALYPAYFHPDEVARMGQRIAGWLRPRAPRRTAG